MHTNNPYIHNHKHGLSQPSPLALPPSLPHRDSGGSSRPGGWSCWQRQVVPEDFPPPAGQPQLSEEENGTNVVKKWMGPQWMSPWPSTFSLHRLRHGLGRQGWGLRAEGPTFWILNPWLGFWFPQGSWDSKRGPNIPNPQGQEGDAVLMGWATFYPLPGHSVSQVNFRPVWSEGEFVSSSPATWCGILDGASAEVASQPTSYWRPRGKALPLPGSQLSFVKWGKWNTSTAETYWNTAKSERGALLNWVYGHLNSSNISENKSLGGSI